MANGAYFLENTIKLLENNTTLQNVIRQRIPIHLEYFSPVGNVYPQICIWLDEGKSETVFPAGHYRMSITVWVKKEDTKKYLTIKLITDAINDIVNRKASSLSDIDVTKNEGLRVARCVKDGGEIVFNRQTGLFFSEIMYDMVISENESFAPADAGNLPWV